MGFGNIIPEQGKRVEGVLYKLEDGMIAALDKYEGYPRHYDRKKLLVTCEDKGVEAEVYIATQEWVKPNLKPSRDYLEHFLAGKEFLSEAYYNELKKTPTL